MAPQSLPNPSDFVRVDSRRLPGVHLYLSHPGAILDARVPEGWAEALMESWRTALSRALNALGWRTEETVARAHPGGVSLAFAAPVDCLFAATEVNEWAFATAVAALTASTAPSLEEALPALRAAIAKEADPHFVALWRAARARGVAFLHDPAEVSVGMGARARVFPRHALEGTGSLDWSAIQNVPTALITGTNGKSTTVRLLAAMVERAGRVPGLSSTDWIRVGREILDEGDWSGPGGARRVLRDPRTEVGILETARGGILRRGLALERADAAAVLNVAVDHLGEWGVWDLDHLADVKMVVTRVVPPSGRVVLNADDPYIAARAHRVRAPIAWFSLDPDLALLRAHRDSGGAVATFDGTDLVLCEGPREVARFAAREAPMTMGGAALYNVANALAAALVAAALGVPTEAIRAGLADFGRAHGDNPGRLVVFELGGVRAVVDFAHNPHGQEALLAMADRMDAKRRLVVLGQAGDRDNESVDELVRITWRHRPDRILIKEMRRYLRGRPPGEMTARIEAELVRQGAGPADFVHVPSEIAALESALEWAKPGDLLLLFSHAEREATVAYLEQLQAEGWVPGQPLPPLPPESYP